MTIEAINEFIKQNGAFGVLILLVIGFCWWGIPYLAKRFESIQAKSDERSDAALKRHEEQQKRHEDQLNGLVKDHQVQMSSVVARFDAQLDRVVSGQREGMKENTQALQGISTQIGAMNERLADVEQKIGR